MRCSVLLQLPNLCADGTDAKVQDICAYSRMMGRGVYGENSALGEDGTVDVFPTGRFGHTEGELMEQLYLGIKSLLKSEEEASGYQSDVHAALFEKYERVEEFS